MPISKSCISKAGVWNLKWPQLVLQRIPGSSDIYKDDNVEILLIPGNSTQLPSDHHQSAGAVMDFIGRNSTWMDVRRLPRECRTNVLSDRDSFYRIGLWLCEAAKAEIMAWLFSVTGALLGEVYSCRIGSSPIPQHGGLYFAPRGQQMPGVWWTFTIRDGIGSQPVFLARWHGSFTILFIRIV